MTFAPSHVSVLIVCHGVGRVHVHNRHLENIQLRVLENGSVPFDVAFFVMQRQKEIKAVEKADRPEGGAFDSRVLFATVTVE